MAEPTTGARSHAHRGFPLHLEPATADAVAAVHDPNPERPVRRIADARSAGGETGSYSLDLLAAARGVEAGGSGQRVWARVARPSPTA
ncbi:hypothetical protein [Streptomyces thermolilacinus]|uniref:Uncharacterized protein n=1 Tax=Streptomyces thermolilacinus SPC6 TaxID=1306406 RepID=A0A1D3DZ99_9ACTN|nr:hypothetical protein [Streptomyces thermolilacinus]OEJ97656.1 hypothetical protein J116_027600 [Streptomyces thermolilacinus SPC6]